MSVVSRASEIARMTPESRNRAADFYRTAAICFVVLGHWFLVAPYSPSGDLVVRSILVEQPWTQNLTWVFQVMPVFFFIGGYANAASWASARRTPERRRLWITGRLRRLLVPVVPLVILWSVAAVVARQFGTSSELVRATSQAALIPVWFLAVYIMVTLVVPVSYAIWERLGLWSVMILTAMAILVDLVGVGMDQGWLRWTNYAPIWLAVHQLGYVWWRGSVPKAKACLLIAIGVIWLAVLIGPCGYPVSMVSVAGEAFSNSRPPTTAMLGLAAVQIGLMLLAARSISILLKRELPWAFVILVGQRIMTVFLWHLTVVIAAIGLSLAFGGIGLRTEPGTFAWWAARPVWILVLIGLLLPFIAVFGRFESGVQTRSEHSVGPVQTSLGAVVTCAGLSMLALSGIGSDGFPGFNWIAVSAILIGVALATQQRPVPTA